MNNKILAIAITDYDSKELNTLSNCKNDLEKVLQVLTNKYQFDDVEFLYEKEDTTRKSLFNKVKYYFANCLDDENVLLLFSGHGQYDEALNATYWQPSDSEHDDSSTWFNLNDLMTFIKVSKAHHISLISDSCFSGAMFQAPQRGGGIEALDKKKSRIGFSSGSIEPVSDGPKGELSPFAKILIDELEKNSMNECPLSSIATNVILNFDSSKNQTPTFAPLSNVGHEGGIFILKLKSTAEKKPKNEDYLKSKYGSIYIPIFEKHFEDLKSLKEIIKRKHEAVKTQDYLEARKIKDEEEKLREQFPKTFIEKFVEENKSIKVSKETKNTLEELDKKILNFEKEIPNLKKRLKRELQKLQKENHNQIYVGSTLYEIENIDEIIESIIQENSSEKEHQNYFRNNKEELIKMFNKSLADLYKFFKKIKGHSISKFLDLKEKELLEIYEDIYESEINYLISNSIDEVDFLIKIKDNELKILKWISNKK